ncbi:ABC transporter permease [Nocardiopsis sp. CNT-189]|uniref:ABC transporter permease n=1 Tax=Nocardiopsis oceanisediminis TaxID=2816862 RepID=UPI003B319A45
MSTTATPAPRAAGRPARPPGALRLGLSRGWLEIREFSKEWERLVFVFSLPAVLLVLLGTAFGGGADGQAVAGFFTASLTATGLMSVSFQNLGLSIATERDDGTLRRLRGLPMPRSSFFLGKVLLVLVLAVGQVALLLGIGTLFYGVEPPPAEKWFDLAWIMLLGTTGCTLLGIAASSAARSARSAQGAVVLPFLALQFISGIFIPVQRLPDWLLGVGSLFPLKWMAQGMRSVFLPEEAAALEAAGSWRLGTVALVLAAWCVVGSVLCMTTFRWKTAKDG